jgi:MFS family permease
MGDRSGPRRVLTRVVLWWSAFTTFTGMVSNYYLLLITRFCFGAGEAGAFPNAAIVVSRWYPSTQRASMAGVLLMASQIGGGVAPLLVVPIQMRYGWPRLVLPLRRGWRPLGRSLVCLVPRFACGEGRAPGPASRATRARLRTRITGSRGASPCDRKPCWP